MTPQHAVSTRAWWLYATMAVLWGVPYLFISVTVETTTLILKAR